MGKSNDQYLEVTSLTPIYVFIIENLSSSHQPLLFKTLRFFLLMIKWEKNLDLLLKENPDLIYKLMRCICSKDRESFTFQSTKIKGAEYNIEIKIYVMKILFMFIKKVKECKPKFSILNENVSSFVKDLAGELDKLHGARFEPKDLQSISIEDNPVRKMNDYEKTYCKTIISFLIQFCKDDSKYKVWVAKIVIIPIIKTLFEQLTRVEQEFSQEILKNTKAEITESIWAKGPLEDEDIEFKYFKLIRSVFINVEDIQITEVKESIVRMTPKAIRKQDEEFGGIFKVYFDNCPRKKNKGNVKLLLDNLKY